MGMPSREREYIHMTSNVTIYASPEEAFLVNSFLVDTDSGILLIDTQFLVSPAKTLREKLIQTQRPLKAVIISHPHPDHFGGTAIVLEGQATVPVYAVQATYDGIKATESGKREFWTPIYKAEYPPTTLLPNKIVRSGETLVIDGLQVIIDDLGAGESSDITVIWFPQNKQLIVSDLVYNRIHPWLAEGRSESWLKQLELVKQRYKDAQMVYAGHGAAGTLALLEEQAGYIRVFRDLVFGAVKNGQVSKDDKKRITDQLKLLYPAYPMEGLIAYNIDGVAGEAT
jgi:glyoxylase-like metal-dependent hydrolase (beta-lactamase superfamily II)